MDPFVLRREPSAGRDRLADDEAVEGVPREAQRSGRIDDSGERGGIVTQAEGVVQSDALEVLGE